MPGTIIVFSGMDGAGKSTQIELLAKRLKGQGSQPLVLWSRGGYTPGMLWLKSILRSKSGKGPIPASGPSNERTQAFSRPMVRQAWLSLAIFDLALLYGFWLRWKKVRGHVVICDRYLDDTLLDFELNFPTENVKNWMRWKSLSWIAPTPDSSFLLTIPVNESLRRSEEKNEPFPDSREMLEKRLARFEDWKSDSKWHVLDGLQSRETLASEIAEKVLHGAPTIDLSSTT